MTFEHYILTRFNLPIFQPKVKGRETTSCDESYLSYRFNLFEQYCMPSIVQQSCQNFKWLVLFDIRTPDKFKQWASHWQDIYPNLIPCYLDMASYKEIPNAYFDLCKDYETKVENRYGDIRYDLADFEKERPLRLVTPLFIKNAIKRCSNTTPDFYVTTRIDNDDAFHHDMVKIIQQKVILEQREVVYDFVYTYKWILNEGFAYRYHLPNGHFITFVEKSDKPFQSVLFWNHLYIELFADVQHFYQAPLQTELIHGNNVVNDFTQITCGGMLYALWHFKQSDFGYKNVHFSFSHFLKVFGFIAKGKIQSMLKNK